MKKKLIKNLLVTALLTSTITFSLTACGSSETESASSQGDTTSSESADSSDTVATEEGDVRTVYVGASASGFPLEYIDDDGNWTGYEVEVLKKVDETLSQYEFEFVDASTQDSIYTGLSTGKYQIALSNAFYTDERAENFNIPENQLGASPCGLIVRKENADVKTLDQAKEAGLSCAPLMAGDGLTYQIELYNREHSDNQISFEYSDGSSQWTDCIQWVAEGRYDFAIFPANFYEPLVTAEDGAYHQYNDLLSYDAVIPVKTYTIIAKDETQLSDDINEVLGQFYEDGTLAEIAVEFYGFNPFDLNTSIDE